MVPISALDMTSDVQFGGVAPGASQLPGNPYTPSLGRDPYTARPTNPLSVADTGNLHGEAPVDGGSMEAAAQLFPQSMARVRMNQSVANDVQPRYGPQRIQSTWTG